MSGFARKEICEGVAFNSIIDFYRNLSMSPAEIRESIKDLSWEEQMKTVLKI